MKKITAFILSAVFALTALAGCGAPAASDVPGSGASKTAFTIGIIQLVEHPSLDEINSAIQTQLQEKSAENGISIQIEYQNAQNDMSTINTICQQFKASEVDCIIAIATPAAQGAAAAVEGTDIPVIFSAVTDPKAAELVENIDAPEGNITGTSDAIPVSKIFDLAAQLTPEAKSFGLIYNTGEVNSVSVINETKAYLDEKRIPYEESAVTSSGDVQTAAQNLLGKCDAIFAPIDNTVATAMTVLAEEAIKARKPVYVAADSMVADGGLATVGVNYTNLGKQTADMAIKVLLGTPVSEIPVEVLKEYGVAVNAETAAAIGVNVDQYVA